MSTGAAVTRPRARRPYWPWSEAIRSYVRDADPVGLRWQLGSRAADVAQLVPELAERLGDVGEPPPMDAEQARFRLFDSVAGFLAGASQSRPLVLVLDDLHWADEPSLLLLRFLARRLADTGLLVVGTYRDVELGRHHPLAETLADLTTVEGARRISLARPRRGRHRQLHRADGGSRATAAGPRRGDPRADRGQSLLHRRGREADGRRGPARRGRGPARGGGSPGGAGGRRPPSRPPVRGGERRPAPRRGLRAASSTWRCSSGSAAARRTRCSQRSARRSMRV